MSSVESVPADEWQAWVEANQATILDVREPDEWELGTLPGALKISMGEIMARIDEIDADRPVLVVCRSGGRSQQAAKFLASSGFQPANMAGGMKALGLQD